MHKKLVIGQSIKKTRASGYSPFETIQLLFETFFNIPNNKVYFFKEVSLFYNLSQYVI